MGRTKPKWLKSTNSPADGQVPSYDNATGEFTWANPDGANDIINKEIEIGDWNMDTTETITVAHGIASWKNIREAAAVIRNDADDSYLGLEKVHHGDAGAVEWDSTNINLHRTTSGHFDSSDYDSTSYNRGFITIWYKP